MAVHCNLSTLMGRCRYSIQDVHKLQAFQEALFQVCITIKQLV